LLHRPAADVEAPSPEALFRYRLVAEVLARTARGERRGTAIGAVAAQPWLDCTARARSVSPRTLYRWLARFEHHGFAGLAPRTRAHAERSRALPAPFLDFLAEEKRSDPRASLPELIRRARERGVLGPAEPIDRSTVYRAAKRLRLPLGRRRRRAPERDTRRFAYPHRMQMNLCDGKHFRAGATRARRVALIFLDDASRYAAHAVVGTAESAALFLRGLYECNRLVGRADAYYLDRGPGFIAIDTLDVVRKLGALLIHGEAAYPEGHGKIERFNQTLNAALLRNLDARPDVDPDPRALELRLQHYLRELYNHQPHESLSGLTPSQRFHADARALVLPDSDQALRAHFVVHLERTVSADHVVSVDGCDYDVPRGHAEQRLLLYRHILDGTLAIVHDERLVELHPLDLAANARARRARTAPPAAPDPLAPPPSSAADLAFARDLAPVVDADGGFTDPPPPKE